MRQKQAPLRCLIFAFALIGFTLLLACSFYSEAQSKDGGNQSHSGSSATNETLEQRDRLSNLEKTLDSLKTQMESDRKATNAQMEAAMRSFEASTRSTERDFTALIVLGTFGGFVSAVFVFLSWHRDQGKYKAEREFYEARIKDQDDREKGAFGRETQLSQKFLNQYDTMLSNQLDSIGKLGNVIALVGKTFELQVKDQENKSTLQQQADELRALLESLNQHYEEQFDSASNLIGSFRHLKRMAWTRLSTQEERIAARARTIFNAIPPNTLRQKEKTSPYELAFIYQLLGVSAFYANDVDEAEQLLKKAYAIYNRDESQVPTDYLNSYASSCHFLGLIDKSWLREAQSIEESLGEAKRHFEKADDLQKKVGKKGEFLTPLTLAEVLSYSERGRAAARERLDELIEQFEREQKLDENQQALRPRAYLLRGNLAFLARDYDGARSWYDRILKVDEKNAYAILSIAQVASNSNSGNNVELYKQGLSVLEDTGVLNKREITTKVLALAWAVIAAHEAGDRQQEVKYWDDLKNTSKDIRKVANRTPMFFCPVTKTLVTFDELSKTLSRQTGRDPDVVVAAAS